MVVSLWLLSLLSVVIVVGKVYQHSCKNVGRTMTFQIIANELHSNVAAFFLFLFFICPKAGNTAAKHQYQPFFRLILMISMFILRFQFEHIIFFSIFSHNFFSLFFALAFFLNLSFQNNWQINSKCILFMAKWIIVIIIAVRFFMTKMLVMRFYLYIFFCSYGKFN